MPRHRRANTTQAQWQNNACTDKVYTAGRGWPQGPNNHSIAANSAECNKCCTDSNSWLKDMNQMLEMLLTIFAPSHLNYVKFHLTTFKFVCPWQLSQLIAPTIFKRFFTFQQQRTFHLFKIRSPCMTTYPAPIQLGQASKKFHFLVLKTYSAMCWKWLQT